MSDINNDAQNRREEARHADTGRFGEQIHTGPEVGLATLSQIDARIERSEQLAREYADANTILDGVRDAANMYALRGGLMNDRDDIVGDTIVDVIGQQRRGTTHVTAAAFLTYATRAVTSRYHDKDAHHTTLTGRRKYHEALEKRMAEEGRMLTASERAEIAEEVRMSFPAGRRPVKGYENKRRDVSLDLRVGDDSTTTFGDLLPAEHQIGDYATATTVAAAAMDALEDEDSSYSKADARKNAWNLISGEGPKVAVKSINDDRAYRAVVDENGGPAAVAQMWETGEAGDDVTDSLFAPFGDLSEKEKEQVTNTLLRHSQHADRLWDAAMTAATDLVAARKARRRGAKKVSAA